ncbi:hypothetical protein B0H11DRAFT_1916895 [Mycena galericulata]|nr:hypothetical protein B0H11DRAFT_1916895 [Mycena galericulata]
MRGKGKVGTRVHCDPFGNGTGNWISRCHDRDELFSAPRLLLWAKAEIRCDADENRRYRVALSGATQPVPPIGTKLEPTLQPSHWHWQPTRQIARRTPAEIKRPSMRSVRRDPTVTLPLFRTFNVMSQLSVYACSCPSIPDFPDSETWLFSELLSTRTKLLRVLGCRVGAYCRTSQVAGTCSGTSSGSFLEAQSLTVQLNLGPHLALSLPYSKRIHRPVKAVCTRWLESNCFMQTFLTNAAKLPNGRAEWQAEWQGPRLLGPSKAGRRVSNFEDIVQQAYDDLKKRVSEEDSAARASQTWSEPQGSVVGGEIIDFAELYQVDSGETEPLTREVIDVVGNDMLRTWRIEDFM